MLACIYICIYIYVYTYVYIYVYTYVYIFIYLFQFESVPSHIAVIIRFFTPGVWRFISSSRFLTYARSDARSNGHELATTGSSYLFLKPTASACVTKTNGLISLIHIFSKSVTG